MARRSGMEPAVAEELAGRIVAAAREALGAHLTAGVLKGSAYKGDFVAYYSDFDVHVFVGSAMMRGPRTPRLEAALRFQSRFGQIDPEAYRVSQCQVYFVDAGNYPADWVGPWPGTYRVLCGQLPGALLRCDRDEHIRRAHETVGLARQWADQHIERGVDKSDRALAGTVRLLGTAVKPVAYCSAIILAGEPGLWNAGFDEVIAMVEAVMSPSGMFRRFWAGAQEWAEVRNDPARLREMLEVGVRALDEAARWHEKVGAGRARTVE